MKKLTIEQQIEALNNALRTFNFEEKYFVYTFHKGVPMKAKFTIAYKGEGGVVNPCTRFMKYEEMNAYLLGYKDAAQGLKRFTAPPQDANNTDMEKPYILNS